jgi:hypothetical protein
MTTSHRLTFQIEPEDAAQGITARCLTCGQKFRDAVEAEATTCEPTKETT